MEPGAVGNDCDARSAKKQTQLKDVTKIFQVATVAFTHVSEITEGHQRLKLPAPGVKWMTLTEVVPACKLKVLETEFRCVRSLSSGNMREERHGDQ